jgi:hypothetical protein
MKHGVRGSQTLAVAVVLLGTTAARADLIQFTYQWVVTPPPAVKAGTGKLVLSNPTAGNVVGGQLVTAASLVKYSTATAGMPDTFAPTGGHYQLQVLLTGPGEVMNTLTFSGQLQGSFWQSGSNLTNSFVDPISHQKTAGGSFTESITIGTTTRISVTLQLALQNGSSGGTLTHFTRLDDLLTTGSGSQGQTIGAFQSTIAIQTLQTVPEPSSTTLTGIALGVGGMAAWRRRRKLLSRCGGSDGQ